MKHVICSNRDVYVETCESQAHTPSSIQHYQAAFVMHPNSVCACMHVQIRLVIERSGSVMCPDHVQQVRHTNTEDATRNDDMRETNDSTGVDKHAGSSRDSADEAARRDSEHSDQSLRSDAVPASRGHGDSDSLGSHNTGQGGRGAPLEGQEEDVRTADSKRLKADYHLNKTEDSEVCMPNQLPHHFIDDKPVYTAISGERQVSATHMCLEARVV